MTCIIAPAGGEGGENGGEREFREGNRNIRLYRARGDKRQEVKSLVHKKLVSVAKEAVLFC